MKKIIILIFCLFNYIKSSEKCLEELETLIGFGLIPAIGRDLYEHTYALASRPIFTLPALNNTIPVNNLGRLDLLWFFVWGRKVF